MDGAIFFFALGLSGLRCLGAWLGFHVAVGVRVCSTVPMLLARACSGSITLTAWAASSSHIGGSGDFFSFALPPPVGSSLLAGLNQSPAPGRGMCEREDDLRLRAGWRFACFLSCRVALSLALVRFRLA